MGRKYCLRMTMICKLAKQLLLLLLVRGENWDLLTSHGSFFFTDAKHAKIYFVSWEGRCKAWLEVALLALGHLGRPQHILQGPWQSVICSC